MKIVPPDRSTMVTVDKQIADTPLRGCEPSSKIQRRAFGWFDLKFSQNHGFFLLKFYEWGRIGDAFEDHKV